MKYQVCLANVIQTWFFSFPDYLRQFTAIGVNPPLISIFKINIATREVSQVTAGFYHGGIYRVLCLSNGDLLLAMGSNIFDATDPEKDRHAGLGLYILTKENLNNPYPLNVFCDEGPAVSKNSMKIAWTLKGQREIKAGEIIYEDGMPKLEDAYLVLWPEWDG